MKVVAIYKQGDTFLFIIDTECNGFMSYYTVESFVYGSGGVGLFKTFEEAEEMLYKHRPSSVRIKKL